MKIALCLSGYFGSTNDTSSSGLKGFKYIKENLLAESYIGYGFN